MKIDLVGPSFPFRGGISHSTTLLFKYLKLAHSTSFYSFKRQYPRFAYPGKTDREGGRLGLEDQAARPLLDALNPFSWLAVAGRIVGDRPDLTIFPWWVIYWALPFLAMIAWIKVFSKSRILFVCHNVVEHEAHWAKTLISKAVLGRGDSFIVHSTQEKENLLRLIGPRPIRAVFPPLYDAFLERAVPKDVAKQKLGIREATVLLFFGFVREYKGLRYLIEALPAILEKLDARLLIAGEFWQAKDPYVRLIKKLGLDRRVTIVDRYVPNEDVPLYFCASDLAVYPYTSVTGSGALQLAKGFHVPVIVTNVGSFAEVVIDKKTGFHVPPKDPRAIAEAAVDFFENYDARQMSRDIEDDNRKFSWPAMVEAIEDLGRGGKK